MAPEHANGSLVSNVIAASVCSIVISTVFFGCRLFCRRLLKTSLIWSDYVLALGVVCCWGLAIVACWMTTVGLGTPLSKTRQNDPSLSNVTLMLKVFLVAEVFYDVGIAAVKISILMLYRSIFRGQKFILMIRIFIFVVCGWCSSNLLPSIFSCRPISGFWDLTLDPPPTCINKEAFYIAGSSINIATDIGILLLPVVKIMELQLTQTNKIGLICTFLLGGLVCAVSIYRMTVLVRANSPDITWTFAEVLLWTTAELAVAVASACLPLMQPLLKSLLRSTRRLHHWGSSDDTAGSSGDGTTTLRSSNYKTLSLVNPFPPTTSAISTSSPDEGQSELLPDTNDKIKVTTTVEMTRSSATSGQGASRDDAEQLGRAEYGAVV